MTEDEWRTRNELELLLRAVQDDTSDRKLRLFGCACCHRVRSLMTDERCRQAVLAAEMYADGSASEVECRTAGEIASEIADTAEGGLHVALASAAAWASSLLLSCTWEGLRHATGAALEVSRHVAAAVWFIAKDQDDAESQELVSHADLLREMVGNPFRPVTFNPAWRTSDVTLLARGVYEERAFDRMPILADALQDAGCDRDELLSHLRDPSATHVRGCWALDLVLGKE